MLNLTQLGLSYNRNRISSEFWQSHGDRNEIWFKRYTCIWAPRVDEAYGLHTHTH